MKTQFNIALIGEVDAGKSTTLGQILLKTGSVLETRIKEAERASQAQNKDFEPAFLLDAFEYERQNEMTVDITSVSCKLEELDIRFLDTPGHKELSNKFIGGASFADLALLILDSTRQCHEEHFRHAQMLSTLGLKDFVVIVNKWESQDQAQFDSYLEVISPFLKRLQAQIHFIIPVSAKVGSGFEKLLQDLKKTLLSLKSSNELLIILKKNSLTGNFWAQIEQGQLNNESLLYSAEGSFSFTQMESCGSYIKNIKIGNGLNPLLAAKKSEDLKILKSIQADFVPLEDSWQGFTSLRTRWGAVKAQLKSTHIELEQSFPFFLPQPRLNLFTLEKDGHVLAVGIPKL